MPSQDQTTILVVDDEPDVTDLYRIWLEDRYDVRTAYDGEAALFTLDEAVDIVLLDRRMPGLSGDEVLSEITDRGLDCRVVMVTAVKPDFDVIDMGFDDYLVKPVSKHDLHGIIESMEKRASYDHQLQDYFSLASKKAVLESEKDPAMLTESEEFRGLETELEDVRERVDETRANLEGHEDFVAAFRSL